MHVFTQWCWIIVRMCESVDSHSGYDFPWSPLRLIPFSVTASYHDFHHYYNVGNFSTFFTLWDNVFDKNQVYYEYMAKRKLKNE